MPAISSLRSQRLSELRSDIEKQYVAFRLRLAWFILPIESIYRVIPLEKHIPKLTFSGQNVPIIDLGKILFGQTKVQVDNIPQLVVNGAIVAAKPSLIVVQAHNEDLVGILSNSQPALQKLSQDKIVPLPLTYSQRWKVDFVSSMTLPSEDLPSLFLIDSDRFVSSVVKHKKKRQQLSQDHGDENHQ
jgi:chemotaxis signal transduction protein